MNDIKHQTRPSIDRIHADAVASSAARQARKDGADQTTCALIYAETYAAAMAEG